MSKKRLRNNRITFYLNDNELNRLKQNIEKVGVKNREAYIRKLTLDGYIIVVDTKPFAELARLVRNATTNINQVARRANESGSVYENDVLDLLREVTSLNKLVAEAHLIAVRLRKQ